MNTLGFIGSGNMAFALAKSFSQTKLVSSIIMSDKNEERLELMKENFFNITRSNITIMNAEIIFISVKPQDLNKVLKEIKPYVKDQIIVSIAAGKEIKSIEKVLGKARLFRVMPNMLCSVNEMSSVYTYNNQCDEQDVNIIDALLNSVGFAVKIDEKDFHSYTVLTGSSPAFFAYIAESFAKASGLDKEIALKLVNQVLIGTGKYLNEDENLIENVMSPNGVTYVGVEELKKKKIPSIMKKVFNDSVKRSKELGK